MSQKQIRVAIGLIVQNGQILVGWRDENLHQGGCYEFPGGKIEANESGEAAVKREIQEEVGIDVDVTKLFHELIFDYSDRIVHLFFYLCQPNQENIQPDAWLWKDFAALAELVFPAANTPIIERLNWHRQIAITSEWSLEAEQRPKPEVGLCYLRMAAEQVKSAIAHFSQKLPALKLIVQHDAYLTLDQQQQDQVFAIHLNGRQLHQIQDLGQFKLKNVIAACHGMQDIEKANLLGCDAILLSPVRPTATHPEQSPLGWQQFQQLARQAQMLVYALGGVKISDVQQASEHSAYGVAGIRDFWQ